MKNQAPNAWEYFNREFWRCHNHDDANGPIAFYWTDKTGTSPLGKDRIIEITLSTRGTADKYEGYTVKIIHKYRGEIASHFFKFSDYLDISQAERDDDRSDYTGPYYAWHNRGEVDWYIAHPGFDTVVDMQSAIIGWLDHYE